MEIYPAIDVLDGRVVRLLRGNYTGPTFYNNDPVAVARSFAEAGARWIHLVDLGAVKVDANPNLGVMEQIRQAVSIQIQTGGGIRSVEAASARFAAGASRIVLGTIAVENPRLADEILSMFPGQVAIGLDARGRDLATHGWKSSSGVDLITTARYFDRPEVSALIVTEIERDGTLTGPSIEQLRSVLTEVSVPIIASGGVASIEGIRALSHLEANGRKLAGVIVGRALYEHKFTLQGALAVS